MDKKDITCHPKSHNNKKIDSNCRVEIVPLAGAQQLWLKTFGNGSTFSYPVIETSFVDPDSYRDKSLR
jgi:hypothetical protein